MKGPKWAGRRAPKTGALLERRRAQCGLTTFSIRDPAAPRIRPRDVRGAHDVLGGSHFHELCGHPGGGRHQRISERLWLVETLAASFTVNPERGGRQISFPDSRTMLAIQSRSTTLRRELLTFKPPLYSMNPSFLNLFMKKFTRERVVPTISASVSCDTLGSVRCDASGSP